MVSVIPVIPNSDGEQAPKDKVRLVGAHSQSFSLDGLQNILVSHPFFDIQEKTQQNEALLLASERDSIGLGNRVAALTGADFLVSAASVTMSRLDLTYSS